MAVDEEEEKEEGEVAGVWNVSNALSPNIEDSILDEISHILDERCLDAIG